jgi:hypothetical protein
MFPIYLILPAAVLELIYLILPAAVLEFTQSVTEMSSRSRKIMFLGRVRRADNLTINCDPIA